MKIRIYTTDADLGERLLEWAGWPAEVIAPVTEDVLADTEALIVYPNTDATFVTQCDPTADAVRRAAGVAAQYIAALPDGERWLRKQMADARAN